jgi:hypothetical protein
MVPQFSEGYSDKSRVGEGSGAATSRSLKARFPVPNRISPENALVFTDFQWVSFHLDV